MMIRNSRNGRCCSHCCSCGEGEWERRQRKTRKLLGKAEVWENTWKLMGMVVVEVVWHLFISLYKRANRRTVIMLID